MSEIMYAAWRQQQRQQQRQQRRLALRLAGATALAALPLRGFAQPLLRVGPNQAVKTLAAATRRATDGMLIEVEAGDYFADVAVWPQQDLTLRAVGGRVRMIAMGAAAQGKGIFVTTGERMRIEGFDFIGASVRDRNGAGIRLERGSLSLFDCGFRDNEQGLLSSNDPTVRLQIENCEFGTIVHREGSTHNLYVGRIGYLKITGSYFHHGMVGHLLKSRAAINHIFYNRLTDETGGGASYELEFPNGGQALVVGNIIQQSATTQNPVMISFGVEGYVWPRQELQLVNNTLVDLLPLGGRFLRVSPGAVKVRLVNNLLAGNRYFSASDDWEQKANARVDLDAFVQPARGDYTLRPDSPLRGKAVDPGETGGVGLRQLRQYQHPHDTVALKETAQNPGAIQLP